MLDTAVLLNAIPDRYRNLGLSELDTYFAMARGHKEGVACEMTKWFNTNYHYVVPELSIDDEYKADASAIIAQYKEALSLGYKPKIQLIGLFTFFALSKVVKGQREDIFQNVKSVYFDLLEQIATLDSELVVEFSEPLTRESLA